MKTLKVKLTVEIWQLPVALGLLIILAIIFPFEGWWIIVITLGLSLAFSYFTLHTLQNNLKIHREMRFEWAVVGDVLEERITIQNKALIPTTWMEIVDHTNIPGHNQAIGTNVGAQSQAIWRKSQTCSRRGLYHLGPTTVQTGDLFNIFHLSIHDPTEVNILITPPVVPLPQIEVASGGRTGDGRMTKGIFEKSIAVSTIRDYQPQDPLNHIHWPISAKRDELTSRVFENTPTGNWWIIQDMNKKVQMGDKTNNTLEVGIILSASLANKGIESGKAVGFISNNRQQSWISPQHASDQTMRILRTLALSEEGDISLEELLKKSRHSFRQTASLIIITPDITLEWWESLIWLRAKGLIPTVIILDPESFGENKSAQTTLTKLQTAGISGFTISAEMFADHINIKENTPWEWRVFGTGQAVPVKKPQTPDWKRFE